MRIDQNSRKSNNKQNIINILKFYLFTVVLVGIAVGFIFSFKFTNIFYSTLAVSTIFILYFIYDNGTKQKSKSSGKRSNEAEEIKLYEPKSTRGDTRLVELKKESFNFILDDEVKEPKQNKIINKKESMDLQNKQEDLKELKKRYNPYKSPFEPINPVNLEVTKVVEESNDEPLNNNEDILKDNISLTMQDSELVHNNTQSEFNFEGTYYNEGENISSYINDIDPADEASITIEESYFDSKLDNNATFDNFNVNSEIKSEEDLVKDISNIIKFRPRIVESTEQNTNTTIYNENKAEDKVAKVELIDYILPPIDLLKQEKLRTETYFSTEEQEVISAKLIDTLASFGVGAKVIDVSRGPSVTRYELQPNAGVKVSKIVGLADDIALNLAATGVRIEAPIPGKAAVGIEVPNKEVTPVLFGDVIKSKEFTEHPSKLAFALGKDVAGRTMVGDVAKMPHMLIAGATGSGKSVCINTLISSILYKATPQEVKLLLIDPKVVELGIYNGIPHLLIPVVTDPKKAAGALSWAVLEMTNRYRLFAENNVRDLKGYNALMKSKNEQTLPQIVIIIDELADLMMVAANDVEDCICRLAQMARAAGMHLVIATQRPSVDVITGVIKANIPSRISFAVSSQIDSRTILDTAGAEKLLGRGDMLYNPIGEMKPTRVQGSFISDGEVESLVSYLKEIHTASYDQDILDKINEKEQPVIQNDTNDDDELLPQVVEMVIEYGQASASLIQRKFKVGYSRAARILDQMESWGIVGQAEGSKPRQILVTKQEWDELNS